MVTGCSTQHGGMFPLVDISPTKRRNVYLKTPPSASSDRDLPIPFPTLMSPDYFVIPSLSDLAKRELTDAGYCSRVCDFTVGRVNYGSIKFFGETDVRWMNLDHIVQFNRHEVVVYEDESNKPEVGDGLNKAAEVTLVLKIPRKGGFLALAPKDLDNFVIKLKEKTKMQGACFVSFNASNGEWRFMVNHFSRFGLTEEDEGDMELVEDAVHPSAAVDNTENARQQQREEDSTFDKDGMIIDGPHISSCGTALSHSLPARLGLDPVKMQEMRMVMFPMGETDDELLDSCPPNLSSLRKEMVRTCAGLSPSLGQGSFQSSGQRKDHRISPAAMWGTPSPLTSSPLTKLALIEYNVDKSSNCPPANVLMTGQKKSALPRMGKDGGFMVDFKHETPIGNLSNAIVDAALFMGRSFRVGWGPKGLLVHTGFPVANSGHQKGLSSVIHIEKVAFDRIARDEDEKVREELIDLRFVAPLMLHKSLGHQTVSSQFGSFNLKLQRLVCNRLNLPEVCKGFTEIVEQQFDVSGLRQSDRIILMHQVMIWELMRVLFSERGANTSLPPVKGEDRMDMVLDTKMEPLDVEHETIPFIRRAEFSHWLQESVYPRVQEELTRLNEGDELMHIFSLLTGRQLDAAVELAAGKGDVRMACLLSQAGGSMASRSDIASQVKVWKSNEIDFNFIEKDRTRLYELLAGNIQGALLDSKIDWKRYFGLLMWYQLPPDSTLPDIIDTYEQLRRQELAPVPIPVYVDEGPLEEATVVHPIGHFDLSYYLMLLHANKKDVEMLRTMFSSFSSTFDALDHHIIWHQRAILEAVGAFSSKDLHVLDSSFVAQLLCLGKCHWAIYVVLHIPQNPDFPGLHANFIKEILFQYCETWSSQELQWKFIEDLGIPSAWMHEALAVYFQYHGDLLKAFNHLLACSSWQKAHVIFVTKIAHSMFLSSEDSQLWKLAISLDEHKSEIADWDLGAGIYIDFYLLRSSLQGEDTIPDLDSLESKNMACRDFFGRLSRSLSAWGKKLHVDVRAIYSKMANELSGLLMSRSDESPTCANQMSQFDTILGAPIPEDQRSSHMQDAVSAFTFFLRNGLMATEL